MTAASIGQASSGPRGAFAARRAVAMAVPGRLHPMVLIYLIAVLTPIGFNIGSFQLTVLRALLLFITPPLLVMLFSGRFGKVYLTDAVFVVFMILSAVALQLSNPDQMLTQMGSVGPEFLAGYAVARGYIRTREDFLALSRLLVWVVVFATIIAIPETLTGSPPLLVLLSKLPVVDSWSIVDYDPRMGLHRVQGMFVHPIHYGLFCSMMFPLALIAMRSSWSPRKRWVLSAIVAANVVMSVSSGALLALVLHLILIGWVTLTGQLRFRWVIFVALAALAYVVVDALSNRTPMQVFMTYATFSSHNAYYRALIFEWGMVNIRANPWFGIGLQDWVRPDWMHTASFDNFWALQAMRYGIPAFIALAIGWLHGLGRIMARDFGDDWTLIWIRRAWVFTFAGLTFTLSTVHVWTNIYSFVFFMFGAGFWLIQARPSEEGAPETAAVSNRAPVYSRFATPVAPTDRPIGANPVRAPAPVARSASAYRRDFGRLSPDR